MSESLRVSTETKKTETHGRKKKEIKKKKNCADQKFKRGQKATTKLMLCNTQQHTAPDKH